MSIRVTALYIFVTFLCIYAWKDWFKSLCGLILLMAIIEHEDMPKTMFGIQGFNTWNILFLVIFLAWAASRRREGLTWDMPRHITILLLMYLAVVIVGVLRVILNHSYGPLPLISVVSEELLNTIKWVVPGILVYDGCRTRKRLIIVVSCLLVMVLLIGVQVARRLPASSVLGDGDIMQTRKACADIGYGACTMSTLLAGLSWSLLGGLPLIPSKKHKVLIICAAVFAFYAQALTGGRAGYVAWGATGLILCLLKWRKQLILAPIIVMLLAVCLPGVVNRLLMGFGETDLSGQSTVNEEALTSGRFLIWPYVVEKIGQSPLIGYGRGAMSRSGLQQHIGEETGDFLFGHPHNMYLESLLDNGIIGSIPIFLFWGIIVVYAALLFRSNNRLCSMVGCIGLSFTLTQMIAGLGSQHFYAEEDTLGIWVAMFITLRVYTEQARVGVRAVISESPFDLQLSHQQHESIALAYAHK